jgi:hypothetical protein
LTPRAHHIIEAATGPMRAIRIDPECRSVSAVPVQAVQRECGCCFDASGHTISELLGTRWQQSWRILDGGELLVTGMRAVGPTWWWGNVAMRGPALVLRWDGARYFSDTQASASDVLGCITWPRRRATARAA